MNQIQVIIGPTASGKSFYSIDLAIKLSAEVISVDAFQVYHDFNIGTGTLTMDERKGVSHHLINYVSPKMAYSVQQFIDDANNKIKELNGKPLIICGGSAMYLKALLYGYKPLKRLPEEERPTGDPKILWKQLSMIDPVLAEKTPYQNIQRVQRYLELYMIYKKPPSELFESHSFNKTKFNITCISIDKGKLKDNIDARVDLMIKNGWIDEVKGLVEKYDLWFPAYKAIGYQDVVNYLQGTVPFDDMLSNIKQKTVQYAKRQITWFKTFDNVNYIDGKTLQ